MIRDRLMKIVNWTRETGEPGIKPPFHREIVEAAKTIVILDLALLKVEIETGLYKKPIEVKAKEVHYEPVSPELRLVIIGGVGAWGVAAAGSY